MFFQALNLTRPDLLHQPIDDFNTRQVALMHRPVKRLSGKGLAMQSAVGIAIEEATHFILQLANSLDRDGHQSPRQVLDAAAICRHESCP